MGEAKQMYPEGKINEFDLKRDLAKNTSNLTENKVLNVKTANEWIDEAKNKPIPLQLFDCLWYQGELAILFADTNLGKSVLAVQIGDALTKQKAIVPFAECKKEFKVLYCDFEMSDKQFENRYSFDYTCHYEFSTKFYRAELNLDEFLLNSSIPIEEQISNEILSYITQHAIDVIIIDNLTYIVKEIEKSKNIAPIMQKLKLINKKFGTSILVLAHTPKRDLSKPLGSSDINGSKFLSNFSDSIFAIGKCANDESLRYVKQIKSRNSAYEYGADNIALFNIEKESNFLGFKYQRTDSEQEHLQVRTKAESTQLDNNIWEVYSENTELSYAKIAKKLETNKMRVKRVVDRKTNS